MRPITLLYFAWVREKVGREEETVEIPLEIKTVSHLLDWLQGRSPEHEAALADRSLIRVAVDQVHAKGDDLIGDSTEIAIFPPMTGGSDLPERALP